jgi:hypothetical protein
MVSTMDTAFGILAYVGALGLTAVASLMLALFVATRARALPGSALLALFLVGVASWSIAQAIPAIIGPAGVCPLGFRVRVVRHAAARRNRELRDLRVHHDRRPDIWSG